MIYKIRAQIHYRDSIMREHHLLSPYRVVQGQPIEHKGKIITAAPNVLWGTDGTKIFTLDDG
jgi:putative transposase